MKGRKRAGTEGENEIKDQIKLHVALKDKVVTLKKKKKELLHISRYAFPIAFSLFIIVHKALFFPTPLR